MSSRRQGARMRGIVTVATVAALGMVLLSGCTPSTPPTSSVPPTLGSSPGSGASSAVTESVNPEVDMNQPTGSGVWALYVTTLEFATQAGGAKAEGGHELAIITVRVSNTSTESAGLGPNAFKLLGPDGTSYQIAPTSSPDFIFNTPQPIKSHETRSIEIAYQVPANVTAFRLVFAPFSPSGATAPATVNVR